jgi:hypothetical protein
MTLRTRRKQRRVAVSTRKNKGGRATTTYAEVSSRLEQHGIPYVLHEDYTSSEYQIHEFTDTSECTGDTQLPPTSHAMIKNSFFTICKSPLQNREFQPLFSLEIFCNFETMPNDQYSRDELSSGDDWTDFEAIAEFKQQYNFGIIRNLENVSDRKIGICITDIRKTLKMTRYKNIVDIQKYISTNRAQLQKTRTRFARDNVLSPLYHDVQTNIFDDNTFRGKHTPETYKWAVIKAIDLLCMKYASRVWLTKGHLAPASAHPVPHNELLTPVRKENTTYSKYNIVPQFQSHNNGVWQMFESELLMTLKTYTNKTVVLTGVFYSDIIPNSNAHDQRSLKTNTLLGQAAHYLPTAFYKIIGVNAPTFNLNIQQVHSSFKVFNLDSQDITLQNIHFVKGKGDGEGASEWSWRLYIVYHSSEPPLRFKDSDEVSLFLDHYTTELRNIHHTTGVLSSTMTDISARLDRIEHDLQTANSTNDLDLRVQAHEQSATICNTIQAAIQKGNRSYQIANHIYQKLVQYIAEPPDNKTDLKQDAENAVNTITVALGHIHPLEERAQNIHRDAQFQPASSAPQQQLPPPRHSSPPPLSYPPQSAFTYPPQSAFTYPPQSASQPSAFTYPPQSAFTYPPQSAFTYPPQSASQPSAFTYPPQASFPYPPQASFPLSGSPHSAPFPYPPHPFPPHSSPLHVSYPPPPSQFFPSPQQAPPQQAFPPQQAPPQQAFPPQQAPPQQAPQ